MSPLRGTSESPKHLPFDAGALCRGWPYRPIGVNDASPVASNSSAIARCQIADVSAVVRSHSGGVDYIGIDEVHVLCANRCCCGLHRAVEVGKGLGASPSADGPTATIGSSGAGREPRRFGRQQPLPLPGNLSRRRDQSDLQHDDDCGFLGQGRRREVLHARGAVFFATH